METLTPKDIIALISAIVGLVFFIFTLGDLKGKYFSKIESLESEVRKLRTGYHALDNEVGVLMFSKGLSRIKKNAEQTS